VEFYVIKDLDEVFSDKIKGRLDIVSPMHATRMGPAIRHATWKLEQQPHKGKFLFLISDGRPQDNGYGRDGLDKEYAINDTRKALLEAKWKNITPFCLTVDHVGHDYLKTMCADMGYEVLASVEALPERLPALYRKITV
jgi:nitric oxide reductase NorD protein